MFLDPLAIGPSDLSRSCGVLVPAGILRARRLQCHWATLGLLLLLLGRLLLLLLCRLLLRLLASPPLLLPGRVLLLLVGRLLLAVTATPRQAATATPRQDVTATPRQPELLLLLGMLLLLHLDTLLLPGTLLLLLLGRLLNKRTLGTLDHARLLPLGAWDHWPMRSVHLDNTLINWTPLESSGNPLYGMRLALFMFVNFFF
jgi:hypothetical protein